MDNAVARNQSHTLSMYRMALTLSESLVSNLLAFFVPEQTPLDHNSAFRAQSLSTSVCEISRALASDHNVILGTLARRLCTARGPGRRQKLGYPKPNTMHRPFRHFSTLLDMFDTLRHFSTVHRANSLTNGDKVCRPRIAPANSGPLLASFQWQRFYSGSLRRIGSGTCCAAHSARVSPNR